MNCNVRAVWKDEQNRYIYTRSTRPLSAPCSTHHVKRFVALGVTWRLLQRRSARKSSITRRTPPELARLSKENDYALMKLRVIKAENRVRKRETVNTFLSLLLSLLLRAHVRVVLRRWTSTEGSMQSGCVNFYQAYITMYWSMALLAERGRRSKRFQGRHFSFSRDIRIYREEEWRYNVDAVQFARLSLILTIVFSWSKLQGKH